MAATAAGYGCERDGRGGGETGRCGVADRSPPLRLALLVRAAVRYDEADGGRLAAAVSYYAFFATFALALLGFAVFGFVLDDPAVLRTVQRYLTENLPRLDVHALRNARGTVGVIAFIGLPITGW
jgi:membrane protein